MRFLWMLFLISVRIFNDGRKLARSPRRNTVPSVSGLQKNTTAHTFDADALLNSCTIVNLNGGNTADILNPLFGFHSVKGPCLH